MWSLILLLEQGETQSQSYPDGN